MEDILRNAEALLTSLAPHAFAAPELENDRFAIPHPSKSARRMGHPVLFCYLFLRTTTKSVAGPFGDSSERAADKSYKRDCTSSCFHLGTSSSQQIFTGLCRSRASRHTAALCSSPLTPSLSTTVIPRVSSLAVSIST